MDAAVATPEAATAVASNVSLAGKYLTFYLGGEEYGLEILKVREIIGVLEVTMVPQTEKFVEGVFNLRGKVIPVVDLREMFGLDRVEHTEETCVIVVDVGMMMGIIVDSVEEVRDFKEGEIAPPPRLGASVDATFILGMGNDNGRVKILLDIDKVLTSGELVKIEDGTDA